MHHNDGGDVMKKKDTMNESGAQDEMNKIWNTSELHRTYRDILWARLLVLYYVLFACLKVPFSWSVQRFDKYLIIIKLNRWRPNDTYLLFYLYDESKFPQSEPQLWVGIWAIPEPLN